MLLDKCPICESKEVTTEQEEVPATSGFFDPSKVTPKKPEVIINCKKCGKFPWTLKDVTCHK
ncbi:MAG: hypothetical protein PHR82_10065 [Endomicrobiaceae bacterium]|nr:hypothetical protein [Endomicrobiaceae bacterium]